MGRAPVSCFRIRGSPEQGEPFEYISDPIERSKRRARAPLENLVLKSLAIPVLGCSLLALLQPAAQAETLWQLWQKARQSEPTYLGARATLDAAQARSRQTLGAMLPQISASASTNDNHRNYETRQSRLPRQRDQYNSSSGQISLNQPIWRYANLVARSQAEDSARQAEYQLVGAEQDLVAKLVVAWFDLLAARDNLVFATRQAQAALRQWQILERGAELGQESAPRAADARAKYEQAAADAVAAETERQLKLAALEQLAGPVQDFVPPYLRPGVMLADLEGDRLDDWLALVERRNPALLAARRAFDASQAEVRKQRAGHQPTLDLVASYGSSGQQAGNFPGQNGYRIKTGTVGLQLNVPIYSGGSTSAKVAEAVALSEKARADVEAARRSAALALKQAWFGWQTGHAREAAGRRAEEAAQAALKLAERGNDNGLRTEFDVLQASQQLEGARRDRRRGSYEQLTAYVKLKALLGEIGVNDVDELDQLLVPSEEDAAPSSAQAADGGAQQ